MRGVIEVPAEANLNELGADNHARSSSFHPDRRAPVMAHAILQDLTPEVPLASSRNAGVERHVEVSAAAGDSLPRP